LGWEMGKEEMDRPGRRGRMGTPSSREGWGLGEPQRDLGTGSGEGVVEQAGLEGASKHHPVPPFMGKGVEMR